MASGGLVFTSVLRLQLQATLEEVITDDSEVKSQLDYTGWCDETTMDGAFADDAEWGGLGMVSEFGEGQEIPVASIDEGYSKRYIARKFGLRMIITEEAVEDNKFPKIIAQAARLSRAHWMGVQSDATQILVRAQNSAYVGGDNVSLWSASHTLPAGGTWSNVMATPMAPSVACLTTARTQVAHYPSQDGTLANAMITKVCFPSDQWGPWKGVLNSTNDPRPGNYSEINVAKAMSVEPVECRFWTATTTQSMFKTNVDGGPQIRWRRRMTQRNWMENSNMQMHHAVTARWTTGWSNARAVLGNPA